MQKLTILIFITLILSPCLYAEEESIMLDRDILYWNPSGPDIQIPDTFFSPEFFRYPEDAFRSTLFYPLKNRQRTTADADDKPILSDEELLLNWTPPALFRVEEIRRAHTLTSYASYPYGSGLLIKGRGYPFSYMTNINYAHGEGYPHWIAAEAGFNRSLQKISTGFAWRSEGNSYLLSILSWNISSTAAKRTSLSLDTGIQSYFPLNDSVESENNTSVINQDHQWKVHTLVGADLRILEMDIGTSLAGEYRDTAEDPYWRISPGLLLSKKLERPRGDWSLGAGIIIDLNEGERRHQFFPQLHISYIDYGRWSLYADSRAAMIEDPQIHSFLTEELYHSPEIAFYRQYIQETGFTLSQKNFQLNAEGGYSHGIFPEIQQGALKSDRKSFYFMKSSIHWNYKAGKVTELNCYADYQDRGSLRYFLESRWLWRKTEEKHAFSFLLRAGNRELLRGYRYFFDESSDFMTETGLELDFFKPLQTAVYIDYLPLNRNFEGRLEISWVY